ncbi:MAG: GTPase HflX [Deltaproteobacteria bacterium]|nr:GTPase HflX [Deltaproteobacteria bacterium]
MDRVYGQISGLKAGYLKRLQDFYRRRIPPNEIVSREITRQICSLSFEIKRQIGIMITRRGQVTHVIVGDNKSIQIPELGRFRSGPGRLKGLRYIHTHLHGEPVSREDITDMVLLGLDMLGMIQVGRDGIPAQISYSHILPENRNDRGWEIISVPDIGRLNVNFQELINSLEGELARKGGAKRIQGSEKAVLAGVTTVSSEAARESLNELKALAISNNLSVTDMVVQNIKQANPRFLIGKGKLSELILKCIQTGSNLLIFDNELTPAQVKSLADYTEMKIIDRSQLILDIFSRRAVTREGKIQVELAQLKYLLPRLAAKNTAMSRLTGGIGGRGPGETKLEINRRRARERVAKLNRELKKIGKQREERRRLRRSRGLPVISIIGYTNAGKSTLLNALTESTVGAGSRLFETLDPSSRRLRFPREREAIITDTVGFIRNLPESLMEAFEATLEELTDADLLLHVVDAASPRMDEQISVVDDVLFRLDLHKKPTILVYNKIDLLGYNQAMPHPGGVEGVCISALDQGTFHLLLERIEKFLWSRILPDSVRHFCNDRSLPST